jgi:excisionase family DNA binding protein
MEQSLLRVNEAAHILNVSRWTVYRWIWEGRLEGTKLGKGSVRVFRDSVTSLIQESKISDFAEPTESRSALHR